VAGRDRPSRTATEKERAWLTPSWAGKRQEQVEMTGIALGAPDTDRAVSSEAHATAHRPRSRKLVVVGQGPAGLRLALQAVRAGFLVIGLDRDARRVGRLSDGRSDLDRATDTALAAALRDGRYVPTADRRFAEGFDTAVVAAAGPAETDRSVAALAPYARPGTTMIIQAPAGSGIEPQLVPAILVAAGSPSGGRGVAVAVATDGGRGTRSAADRAVDGLDARSTASAAAFYRELAAAALLADPPTQFLPAQPVLDPPTLRFTRPAIPAQRAPARPAAPRTTVSTVTVIVPAYNEEEGIASTIEGLLAQDAPEWLRITDVVVVVNNSTDRTAEIARRYPVTVLEMLHNPHKKSGAMNHGWQQHGRGSDFVLTMDADTVLLPDTVEKMAKELVENPVLGAVCSRYWAKEGRGLVRRLQRLEYARYDDLRELRGWKVNVASGAAAMYRQLALQEVVELRGKPEPWDNESLIEDYALTLDLKSRGWKVGAAREAHVYTEPPTTFRALWRQRLRWGRGGMDECLKRGWTRATRRDILAYALFSMSVFFRVLWIVMLVLMLVYAVPLRYALIGLVPVAVMWAERVTSAWRLRDRTAGDMALVAVLVVEDLYGFFLELCAVAAASKCLRGKRQAW
jgi:glycosyltransferase involved in cell wall biosynthesis